MSEGPWVAVGCALVVGSSVAAGAAVAVGVAATVVATAGAACSPPQAARAVRTARHSSSTVEAIPVPVGLPHNDFMAPFSAPGTVASMTRPVYPPGVLLFDSAGAGGWVCPVGARMANKRPPGGEGLSPIQRTAGDCHLEVTLLQSVVSSWQTGPVQSPGYVRQSEDRLSEPQSRPRAWAGMARHPVGGGRCGAHRRRGPVSSVRSAEYLSRR